MHNSIKYPLKPGDIVISLRSKITSSPISNSTRLLLVHRFWIEPEEQSRHVVVLNPESMFSVSTNGYPWMENFLVLNQSTNASLLYVKNASKLQSSQSSNSNGYITSAPTIGKLNNGKPYIIYRYLLFSDGFLSSKSGKQSSDGIYIVPLNFPIACRKSSSAGRVISLAPPGVSPYSVVRALHDDIIRGSTQGFEVIDGAGTRRMVFTDLVGVFSDTPALNAALDHGGHNGNAPCHLFRCIPNSITRIGSLYANETPTNVIAASRRFFHWQQATRDSNPALSTVKYLGMKQVRTRL